MSIEKRKDLPAEIWLMILRFVTQVINYRAVESGFLSELDGALDLETHWRMLAEHPSAKLPFAHINRSWCNLVTPIIYEQIVIRDLKQEQLLLRTLENSPRNQGKYVRALFIGVSVHVHTSVPETNELVSRLLRRTPKLKVYGFRCAHIFGRPAGTAGFHALTPTTCHLASVTVHTNPGVVAASLYEFLLSVCGNLRTLETSLPRRTSGIQPNERMLFFPKLHTITIVRDCDAAALSDIAHTWVLPALRAVRGLGHTSSWPSSIFPTALPPFCKDGSSIGPPPSVTSVTYTGSRVCNNFHELFPNISEMTFEVVIGRLPVLLFPSPIPTCVRVGIITHDVSDDNRRAQARAISDQFNPLSNPVTFPNLRLIRVMFHPSQERWIELDSHPASEFFKDRTRQIFWAYWSRIWQSRGVRLEAVEPHSGRTVSIVELNESPEFIAAEYERYWAHPHVGHGDESDVDDDESDVSAINFGEEGDDDDEDDDDGDSDEDQGAGDGNEAGPGGFDSDSSSGDEADD
ncbi:hypothetical protein DL93DRAFT_2076934 [Clavulina sp. PMI_390]|nr:hypothetical protein DL93DRAFT_2076934 [Clavulina sp. PMI_390]